MTAQNTQPRRPNPARIVAAVLALAGLLSGTACTRWRPHPELGRIYQTPASHQSPQRNPVIVIPGILGSKLLDTESGTTVWGAFSGKYANPERPEGAALVALPMRQGEPLDKLHDTVEPTGSLDTVQFSLFGLPVRLKAYFNILQTLGVGGYRDEQLGLSGAVVYPEDHYSCFQFSYDWRRDNVENAHRLGRFIEEKRKQVQAEIYKRFKIKDHPVKFDIVAHSMGGLVARYYLRYGDADLPDDGTTPEVTWKGARHIDRVVLVGTPSAGSVSSLMQLVHGNKLGPFLPRYPPAVLGTMPSVYQLLPRARHASVLDNESGEPIEDLYDPALWTRMGWGLADHNQGPVLQQLLPEIKDPAERRRIALDHLDKCLLRARRFAMALDQPATPPPGTTMHLFAGDAEPTAAVTKAVADTGALYVTDHAPGDGTVLRTSALMDERQGQPWTPRLKTPITWHDIHFLFTDHLGLTRDPAFTDAVLYLLLEAPHPDRGE